MSVCEFLVQFGFVAHPHTLGRQFTVGDAKHVGANPIDLGECDQIPATILPGTKPTPSNPLPLHPTGRWKQRPMEN